MSPERWELVISAELGRELPELDAETIAIVRAARDLSRARIRETIERSEEELRAACGDLRDRFREPRLPI